MRNKLLYLFICVLYLCVNRGYSAEIYVAPEGNDNWTGSREKPLASLEAARQKARDNKGKGDRENTIVLKKGTYYLNEPLVLTSDDSGLSLKAAEARQSVLSGARVLSLEWKDYKEGIMQAKVAPDVLKGQKMDGLMVNGMLKRMARYPNADSKASPFEGTAADVLSPQKVSRWSRPEGAYLHTMHGAMWGSLHYEITGKKSGDKVEMEGGWQNNRGSGLHPQYRFVENVFEELDSPGEWYFDDRESVLYYYPEKGEDMTRSKVEGILLENLVELRGTQQNPVKDIEMEDVVFTGTARTFMKTREALLSSDWMIYRGGAVLLQGVVDCEIKGCDFYQLGGNAVFVNGYNRDIEIEKCFMHEIGASGVAFVGNQSAYRGPAGYEAPKKTPWEDMDKTPGPRSDDYPASCTVEDCLMTRTGRIEKQSASVEIAMAQDITVRHCSLYDVPRAGINIGDGCWGGHLIEFCDVFDTVKESSDHGSFNSWGRDRFWGAKGLNMNDKSKWESQKGFPVLDAVKTNVIRNSRWRCDHGWDIDLDDGSGNYEIYNNLMLNRGLKLREGFFRKAYNNITVNSSLHPHVWFATSGDVVKNNIFFVDCYFPAGGMPAKPWGAEMDGNFVHVAGMTGTQPAEGLQKQSGRDEHSLKGDALFQSPEKGDFRLKEGSPALKAGFKNFPMDKFGVQEPRLKEKARTPDMPDISARIDVQDVPPAVDISGAGARVRDIRGLGDRSAYGLVDETGVLILDLAQDSPWYQAGIRADDVIVKAGNAKVENVEALKKHLDSGKPVKITARRAQKNTTYTVNP